MHIAFALSWLNGASLGAGHATELLRLLRALRDRRSLREAAEAAEVSYRFAWGLLTAAARDCGEPLVEMRRGRGTTLTDLGHKLLWLDEKIDARLSPLLERLTTELQPELERLVAGQKARLNIFASHDLALVVLRDLAAARGVTFDLRFMGSGDCLQALAKRHCEVAGFHTTQSAHLEFAPLRPDRYRVVQFALREQGLMRARGALVHSLRDLTKKSVRFINRQKGSGTRELLDRLLASERIPPASIRGYENEEYTHLAVAATVAAGHADAGIGIRAAAQEYALEFVPVATERYCLACTKSVYESAAFQAILALLRDRSFRRRAAALPGYDLSQSGTPLDFVSPLSSEKK